MPNINILAQAILKISCIQGFSIAIMARSKKGHNSAILGPTEKKKHSLIFCTVTTYKIPRFYTNWFPRYSRHLIFAKRGITLAVFDV